ncbi:uncharacterized protein LOC120840005 [Ixodes scapularis]|uniref:uncharacterized protein LOC120840005 n=1 Tax=Ixodes scapularis TaxID=6945 RepID=UPI001A9FCE17|nr:uncharacterized protein LOC120840005 [Ixodes scapularis]
MTEKQPTTIKELAKFLSKLSTKLDVINTKVNKGLSGMSQSMTFMNKGFNKFKATMASATKEIKQLKAELQQLKKENQDLAKELEDTKRNLVKMKQYCHGNLKTKGIPHSPHENLAKMITAIGGAIGVEIASTDIDVNCRMPTKNQAKPNVIVRFLSHNVRDKVLMSAKQCRPTSDAGFKHSEPVYENEHLCPENKVFLGKVTEKKKANNWEFLWVSQGKILMKKAENSGVVQIISEADLLRLCN